MNFMFFTDARFEVFTAVKIHVKVFWVLTPRSAVVGYQPFGGHCFLHLQVEIGGSMVLRNAGILPQHYTASKSRRPRRESPLFIIFFAVSFDTK
jgi:hypothetical protein